MENGRKLRKREKMDCKNVAEGRESPRMENEETAEGQQATSSHFQHYAGADC